MPKMKLALTFVFMLVLVVLVVGCFGANKATGGGWFIDMDTGNYVTVGFNGQYVGEPYEDAELGWIRDAKGQVQFIDQTSGASIHGKFIYTVVDLEITDTSIFMGECTIDRVGPYTFALLVDDVYVLPEPPYTVFEDVNYISLFIDMNGSGEYESEFDTLYQGMLEGGEIRIHVS